MVALNGTVRLVALQFSFSNPDAIPASVKRLNRETQEERVERKGHSSGVMVIEPTEKCSLAEFLGELETAGYEMVDAFYKERIDAKDSRRKRTYHMARFQERREGGFRPECSKHQSRSAHATLPSRRPDRNGVAEGRKRQSHGRRSTSTQGRLLPPRRGWRYHSRDGVTQRSDKSGLGPMCVLHIGPFLSVFCIF